MPTPNQAFAAVAHTLGGVDPSDSEAVTMFYRHQFTAYELPVRALISDFLIGSEDVPSEEELSALKRMVDGPVADIPELEAPAWNERYGAAMTYEVSEHVHGSLGRAGSGLEAPMLAAARAAEAS